MPESRQRGTSGETPGYFGGFFGDVFRVPGLETDGATKTVAYGEGTFGAKDFTPKNIPVGRGRAPNSGGYTGGSS